MKFYIDISKILLETEKGKSFKKAIYDSVTAESPNFKKTYKIVIEMIKNKKLLDEIVEKFFENEDIHDINLFRVLMYEFFFSGKKMKIGGSIMKIIKTKKEQIENYLKVSKIETNSQSQSNNNISKSTSNDFEAYNQIEKIYFRINKQKVMNEKNIMKRLREKELIIKRDDFIEGMFYIENNKSDLSSFFKLRDDSEIIIQTKSSALPAFILKKAINTLNLNITEENFNIIDSCSAPGNKTLQLAEYFPNSTIYAYEKDPKRFGILNSNMERNNHFRNIETYNEDFLESDVNADYFKSVRIILSDPSCSGSGTKNNLMENKNLNKCCIELAGSEEENNVIDRLKNLSGFQYKIVSHCMKFPNVKYISYSTCSVFSSENENVVERLLKHNDNFELMNIFDYLDGYDKNQFHEGLTEKTKMTLRACRKCSNGGNDGFFVALFRRKE